MKIIKYISITLLILIIYILLTIPNTKIDINPLIQIEKYSQHKIIWQPGDKSTVKFNISNQSEKPMEITKINISQIDSSTKNEIAKNAYITVKCEGKIIKSKSNLMQILDKSNNQYELEQKIQIPPQQSKELSVLIELDKDMKLATQSIKEEFNIKIEYDYNTGENIKGIVFIVLGIILIILGIMLDKKATDEGAKSDE